MSTRPTLETSRCGARIWRENRRRGCSSFGVPQAPRVPLSGEPQREAIRVVLDTFGQDARSFVFLSCVLGLYARSAGAVFERTFRVTERRALDEGKNRS